MKQSEPVSGIMTKSVITANVTDNLRRVSTLMKEHQVRHLPVVSGKKLVGIVSKSDILRLSFGDMFEDQHSTDETVFDMLTLEQVMVNNPITVNENESIAEVAKKFTTVEFHALPVVNGEEITGIISTTDLIRYLLTVSN